MRRKPLRFRKFDPLFQAFSHVTISFKEGDGDGNGGGGGDGDKNTPKTFEFKTSDDKKFVLPDVPEIREFVGHSIMLGRKDSDKKYKETLDALNSELSKTKLDSEAIKDKLRAFEEAGLSDAEKYKRQQERDKLQVQQDKEKILNEKKKYQDLFTNDRISNEIMRGLSKFELNNPHQTAMLIKGLGGATLIEDEKTGEFKVVVNAKNLGLIDDVTKSIIEGEIAPEEAIQKFLALPENAHHLKSNLRPGGNTSQTGGKKNTDGTVSYSRVQLSDPKIREEYNKKRRNGEKVSISD